jgi:hypothetical protein
MHRGPALAAAGAAHTLAPATLHLPPRAEAAIASGGLPRLAAELRGQLGQLARADYSGQALLQAKKQARRGRGRRRCHTGPGRVRSCGGGV